MESINIQNEVLQLLQLVQESGNKYPKGYLVYVLKGNSNFTREEHKILPQFGSISHWSENKINMLFNFLIKKEYLELNNNHKGIYEVSERGQRYIQKPSTFWIKDFELKPQKKHYYLAMKALKEERKLQSKEKNCNTYELCSNFQLEQIIIQDFKSVEELCSNPIFSDWDEKVDWDRMLIALKNAKKEYYDLKNLNRYENYKKIETLVNQNKTINEILNNLNIKISTLTKYVEALFENGNQNLKTWIYKNVNKSSLVKCIEYFTRTKNLKLVEAKLHLKLDYETIKLGRIYYRIQQLSVAA